MTSSQNVEQIEATQKLVLAGMSKLNDPALDKKQVGLTQFSPKVTLEKKK